MQHDEVHGRGYVQHRVHEEIDRFRRHGDEFSLIVFKARPGGDGVPVRQRVGEAIDALNSVARPSDVIARVFDDAIAMLLVRTGPRQLPQALRRLERCLALPAAVRWQVDAYAFPRDEEELRHLSFLTAA